VLHRDGALEADDRAHEDAGHQKRMGGRPRARASCRARQAAQPGANQAAGDAATSAASTAARRPHEARAA
jgi:hypothetical protein